MAAPRIPSLNWLRVFAAAARSGSFARAAEALAMSPPAVSQQIRALEGYLGRPLFERGARSVRLTEAGRAFLPVVSNALASVETTAASLFGRADARTLSIRVSTMLACSWLAARLDAFARAHPNVLLTIATDTSEETFRRRDAELTITFGQPPGPGEEGDVLFGERLCPVACPAIAAQVREPADLARLPLIEVTSHRANWWRLLPEPDRLSAPPRFAYVDTTVLALALAGAGGGVALARAPASDALVTLHGLEPCPPGLAVAGEEAYHLVYAARDRLSPAAAAFRAWLLDLAASEMPGRSGPTRGSA